ncbi:Ankyrin repeat and FYVE domain-containing protein 1 [Clonorchis sinensis]|uniref:Ankyrin repeat and FYVE domain-containing protein 1 n=1 Tax=Clonorchis sinensis TaxID=79923 RepID=A0A8T1MBD5_CLOSI|nr:Ankyrin repeat and FYVE domain-containing protein 1 [Clonorchis sinensis]
MDSQTEFLTAELNRLTRRVNELQKENSVLLAALGKRSHTFCSNIIEFVKTLQGNEKLSDILVQTADKVLPGHQFVIGARGGKWEFVTDGDHTVTKIDSNNQAACEALLSWLYTGELLPTDDAKALSELIVLARKHELSELVSQCETMLSFLLRRDNCVILYEAAFVSKAFVLLEHCFSLLSSAWDSISKEELNTLSPKALLSLLEKKTRFPLHCSIELERDDVAMLILEENPVDVRTLVNVLDDNGLSPLYLSLKFKQIDLAEYLLENGALLDLVIGENERMPTAHYALMHNELEAVQFLIGHGFQQCPSQLKHVDSLVEPANSTLLHALCQKSPEDKKHSEHLGLARSLLSKDGNAFIADANGNTPLHVALLHCNTSMFGLLMEHVKGADFNAVNNMGFPLLWLALVADFGFDQKALLDAIGFSRSCSSPQSCSFSKTLVHAGADVNYQFARSVKESSIQVDAVPDTNLPEAGDTLLIACARCGLDAAALFLLQQPVCLVNAESATVPGETVFHVAIESKLTSLCHSLATSYQADPNRLRMKEVGCTSFPGKLSSPRQPSPPPLFTETKKVEPFDLFPDDEEFLQHPTRPVNEDQFITPFDAESLSERLDPDGEGQNLNVPEASLEKTTSAQQTGALCRRTEKRTPLHLAMARGMTQLIELYLDQKAKCEPDWLLQDEAGDSVFSLALWTAQFDLANRILIAASRQYQQHAVQPLPNGSTNNTVMQFDCGTGLSLLQRAVERDQLEAVRFLLRHRVDANNSFGSSGTPPTSNLDVKRQLPFINLSLADSIVCPLWSSLLRNQPNIAQLLVSHGADVDYWTEFAGTPVQVTLLHRAIDCRLESATEFLIKNGCDVNATPRYPQMFKTHTSNLGFLDALQPLKAWHPLHMASANGLVETVRCLLRCGRADVNRQDVDGNTAVHLAVRAGHNRLVEILIQCPVLDCGVKNSLGHTAFHVAMECRNVKAAQSLLSRDSTLALQTDNLGRNFLHIALQNVDRAAVFFLIQTGMNLNQCVNDSTQYTPLHLAIIAGVPEDVFRSLLLAGASISSRTPQKHTPLHLCILHNQPELLNCLIENGAEVNEQDSEMNTPLHLAVRNANIPCLTILLAQPQTDCCIMNIRGQLPIHLLAEHNSATAVEILQHLFEICVTPQINSKDAAGNTPLLLAYRSGNVPLCIALVHAGASLGLTNADGHSVFSLSRLRKRSASPDRILMQILDSLMQEPLWEDGPSCVECQAKFGLTYRKHHCRHCGRLLCAQCSNFEVPIIKFGINKPVRVCETCFDFLNNPLGL